MIENISQWVSRHESPVLDVATVMIGSAATGASIAESIDIGERMMVGGLTIILLALRIWTHVKPKTPTIVRKDPL